MKATEGHVGRVYVIRLEDGDVVPECIERFAEEEGVRVGRGVGVEVGVGVRYQRGVGVGVRVGGTIGVGVIKTSGG